MTIDEALLTLQALRIDSHDDPESAHAKADKVLCDLLDSLGHSEVVIEWEQVARWYA